MRTFFEAGDLQTVNSHTARLSFHLFSLAGQLIQPSALHLDRRDHGGNLADLSDKRPESRFHLGPGNRHLPPPNFPSVGVQGIGGHPEAGHSQILLGQGLEKTDQPGNSPHRHHQGAGGHWIEGSGVSHFADTHGSPHRRHHVM